MLTLRHPHRQTNSNQDITLKTHNTPTVKGLLIGGSGFIALHWAKAALSSLFPRISMNHCVPGRPENIEKNAAIAAKLGFSTCYTDINEAIKYFDSVFPLAIIATPNDCHERDAIALMENRVNVAIDKPLAHTVESALKIAQAARRTGVKNAILPTYCGYPAILEVRKRLHLSGKAGTIRGGSFNYYQGWLRKKYAEMTPEEGKDQALWRKIEEKSGAGGALGDILSHLLFQLYFTTGLPIVAVKHANRRFVVEGRTMVVDGRTHKTTDDDTSVICVLENGAEINCHAVQYANDHRNDNSFELWTTDETLKWDMASHPEILKINNQLLAAEAFSHPWLKHTNTLPSFHGEGWHDAGSRILQALAWEITNTRPEGVEQFPLDTLVGLNVNKVIDAVVCSAENDGQRVETGWINSWDDLPA
ncbi:MAG: Gfo/Idh/MocA family oxidoreductase [Candidatus Taylorbacteria bacterium]|nr:Gfo/Idh/MocA family oxidoreductase [Candidatus Taylorbacteria bacterium]